METRVRGCMFCPGVRGLYLRPSRMDPYAEKCVLGEPSSPRLVRVHHRPFVNDFWEDVVGATAEPVEEDRSLGVRRVQILGQKLFTFLPDGTLFVQEWVLRANGSGHTRVAVDPFSVFVSDYVRRSRWVQNFVAWFRDEAREVIDASEEDLGTYTSWFYGELLDWTKTALDRNRLEARICEGLALDERALAAAAGCPNGGGRPPAVTVGQYNEALARLSQRKHTE